ncbi:hypothetical protein [Peredibacter starrii]|uniref:Major outer membrane protein n=1 Tax=Peredibacter starrii TaxID=28202 RepID=Q5GPL1_9BACT|nr:hypothetical protein [Peredibacter starrii]WPU64976.1 hypothetical protein SOO65_19970 [Peredibacter starrii]CAH17839.1 major outer membrane protein precursor [Peredibacter starrii]
MKKQLTVALGLAVLATPAFATKARLQALGEDSYGSAYINDNRNIWLNSAQVNNHKDLVTYEFGGNVNQDSNETARGEGGAFKAMGNMVYGVQFGGASNTGNALRTGAGLISATGDFTDPTNPTDVSYQGTGLEENNIAVFVGGDMGLKWGANLEYAKTAQEDSPVSSEAMRTRLGVIMGDTQVYANINLINNAKGETSVTPSAGAVNLDGTAKFEGDLGYQVGAIHAINGNTLFVDYRSFDMSSDINATGTLGTIDQKKDISSKQGEIGIGRVERLNDKTSLFLKGSFFMRDIENDHGKGAGTSATLFGLLCSNGGITACEEYKTQRVPVVIGLETEATSWLTLRGSVSQVVWGTNKINGTESTVRNSTAINAGATLKFGELSVDGVIGTADAATAVAGENTAGGNGTLRTDNLMSRVAMTYRF